MGQVVWIAMSNGFCNLPGAELTQLFADAGENLFWQVSMSMVKICWRR